MHVPDNYRNSFQAAAETRSPLTIIFKNIFGKMH